MNYRLALPFALLTVVVCLVSARPARATTIVPVSDEDLALSSQAIVEGRCLKIEPAWDPDRTAVFSYVTFKVTRVIKGDLQPGRIVLKQLGGATTDGQTVIWGAPYWQENWEMLLYLNPDSEGALRVAHLSLGYFRLLDGAAGKRYVARPDPGENVTVLGTTPIAKCEPYDEFMRRLEATLAAYPSAAPRPIRAVPADYRETAAKSGGSNADFRFLSPGFRWFEPDTGGVIRYRVNSRQAPTPSGGVDEARAAADAWSTVPGSSLRVEISGATDACGLQADGVNAISFNDCTGRFDPPVNCTGVIAIGGVAQATPSQTVSIGGRSFARIQDGDVIFNPGFGCILSNSAATAEIMTHEMGHSLGFGHSSEQQGESNMLLRDATMFFITHLDGRGATLREDDMDGARFLYRSSVESAPLAIVTDAVPDIEVGATYGFALKATGSGPFTWSVAEGSLPTGITLSSSGQLSGTCVTEQVTMLTVRVRDAANFEQTRAFELRASRTPAPFVVSAKFKSSAGKLVLTAVNVGPNTTITINGIQVAPPATVKLKASKNRLVLKGTPADLNVRATGPNTVVVVTGDLSSNALSF